MNIKQNILNDIPENKRYKLIDILLNYEQEGISVQRKQMIIEHIIIKDNKTHTPIEQLLYENMYNILNPR